MFSGSEECHKDLNAMLMIIMDCEHHLSAVATSSFPDNDQEKLNAECRDPHVLLDYFLQPTLLVLKQLLQRATQ